MQNRGVLTVHVHDADCGVEHDTALLGLRQRQFAVYHLLQRVRQVLADQIELVLVQRNPHELHL